VGGGKRNHHPSFLVVGCAEQAEDTSQMEPRQPDSSSFIAPWPPAMGYRAFSCCTTELYDPSYATHTRSQPFVLFEMAQSLSLKHYLKKIVVISHSVSVVRYGIEMFSSLFFLVGYIFIIYRVDAMREIKGTHSFLLCDWKKLCVSFVRCSSTSIKSVGIFGD